MIKCYSMGASYCHCDCIDYVSKVCKLIIIIIKKKRQHTKVLWNLGPQRWIPQNFLPVKKKTIHVTRDCSILLVLILLENK